MFESAMPRQKGEISEGARATDEELLEIRRQLEDDNPGASVYVQRLPGGATRITIATRDHGLYIATQEEG